MYCEQHYTRKLLKIFNFNNPFRNIKDAKNYKGCYRGSECKYIHDQKPKKRDNLKLWDRTDKDKVDLNELFMLVEDKLRQNHKKCSLSEKEKISSTIGRNDFIKTILLWEELSFDYGKKAKKPGINKSNLPNFHFSPGFETKEEYVWCLARELKYCSKHQEARRRVNGTLDIYDYRNEVRRGNLRNKDKLELLEKTIEKPSTKDLCLGGIYCKYGCHEEDHLICHDDILTNSCDKRFCKKIHYCRDKGMICFSKSRNDYLEEQEKEKQRLEKIESEKIKKVKKEDNIDLSILDEF